MEAVEVPATEDVQIIRRVVFWMGLVQAVLGALTGSTAFMGAHPAVPGVLGAATLVVGAVQSRLERTIQDQVTANADVVEARVGADVVAGQANSLVPAGVRVRDVSEGVAGV